MSKLTKIFLVIETVLSFGMLMPLFFILWIFFIASLGDALKSLLSSYTISTHDLKALGLLAWFAVGGSLGLHGVYKLLRKIVSPDKYKINVKSTWILLGIGLITLAPLTFGILFEVSSRYSKLVSNPIGPWGGYFFLIALILPLVVTAHLIYLGRSYLLPKKYNV